jgi:hypothetical protein
MKNIRLIAALALAFGSLALAQPALASEWQTTSGRAVDGSVQFDYRGGSASQTLSVAENSTLTITVNNTIANCIGNCNPIPDTWSLTINGERWEGNSIETVTIQTVVSAEVLIQATGKDEGFWGGWYGPIFSAPIVTEPEPNWWAQQNNEGEVVTITAPAGWEFAMVRGWYGAPDDWNCGADVSAILGELFLGRTEVTVALDNGTFGDPCGGVYKVTRLTWGIVPLAVIPTPEPTPTPTPEPTPPTSIDAVDPIVPVAPPVVEPVVTPPVIEPQPQPQPIPYPVQPAPEPEPAPAPEPAPPVEPEAPIEPAPEPALPPEEEPAPAPAPAPEPPEEPAPVQPEPAPKPEPVMPMPEPAKELVTDVEAILDIAPEDMTVAQVELLVEHAEAVLATAEQGSPAYQEALQELAVAAEADDAELPEELAAIPLLGDVMGAALDVFNNIGNIGADMAPEQRERAEETIVAAVVVGQVAQTAMAAAASAGSVAAGGATRKVK